MNNISYINPTQIVESVIVLFKEELLMGIGRKRNVLKMKRKRAQKKLKARIKSKIKVKTTEE